MTTKNPTSWRLDRRVNLSALLQIATLASLIVGSWLNLQRQLDALQRDVTILLETQARLTDKFETLTAQTIAHEYRLQALESSLKHAELPEGGEMRRSSQR